MSGIARLLKWAPCLWAISRLANGSGQAQRTHILNPQSGPQHHSGPSDVLHSLSFAARTVVKHSHIPRASPAPRRFRSQAENPPQPANQARRSRLILRVPGLLRRQSPHVHIGWQWECPPYLPIRIGIDAVTITSRIIRQATGAFFAALLPAELRVRILEALVHPDRRPGARRNAMLRLVCKEWDQVLRTYFWRRRWLNIRPENATWASISERLRTLIKNADVITKVKLSARLTDIGPTSVEVTLQNCQELAELAFCDIRAIKVGRLDSINEVLFQQIMLYHQERITHFAFRFDDTILFLGRRSLFADSNLFLPSLRRITIDISNSAEALVLEDLYGNSAGPVSYFVAELVGREGRAEEKNLEFRLFCQPNSAGSAQSQIEGHHILLATQIFESTRALIGQVQGIELVWSFQGPLRSPAAHDLQDIRTWAREKGIRLLDAPVQQGSLSSEQDDQSIAREVRAAQDF